MRKQIFPFALMTIFGLALYAAPQEQAPAASVPQAQAAPVQSEGARRFDPNRQSQRLTKKLNLTADQQQQLLPILTDRNQQVQAVLNDNSLSRKDRHERMLAIRQDSENKIKAVLTPEQQQAYDKMLQEAREHHRNNKKPSNVG
jgi:Spy/CpxP family protein refolding chaperone